MKQVPNTFTSFVLNDEEYKAGTYFTTEQRAVIHNLISTIAAEKLLLKFDPAATQQFLQREAELAGQIGILQHILSLSETE